MRRVISRMGLISLGALLIVSLSGCDKNSSDPTEEESVPNFSASYSDQGSRLLVGICYYPWYTEGKHWGGHRYMRAKLEIPQQPTLGEYDCADQAVISQHVDWSVDFGIDFWISSWWGPGSSTDEVITDAQWINLDFMQKLGYCLLYETSGRLGGIPIGASEI